MRFFLFLSILQIFSSCYASNLDKDNLEKIEIITNSAWVFDKSQPTDENLQYTCEELISNTTKYNIKNHAVCFNSKSTKTTNNVIIDIDYFKVIRKIIIDNAAKEIRINGVFHILYINKECEFLAISDYHNTIIKNLYFEEGTQIKKIIKNGKEVSNFNLEFSINQGIASRSVSYPIITNGKPTKEKLQKELDEYCSKENYNFPELIFFKDVSYELYQQLKDINLPMIKHYQDSMGNNVDYENKNTSSSTVLIYEKNKNDMFTQIDEQENFQKKIQPQRMIPHRPLIFLIIIILAIYNKNKITNYGNRIKKSFTNLLHLSTIKQ